MTSIFFQAVGEPFKSAIVSLSRDIIFFVPLVFILPNYLGVNGPLWAAPIADTLSIILTIIFVYSFFKNLKVEFEKELDNNIIKPSHPGVIITISREHGSAGKYIGELIAKELKIPFYYKELTAMAAKESGLDKEFVSKINQNNDVLHELYLTSSPVQYAIEAQEQVINKIANEGACVLVGRAADHVLRNNKNVIKIFIYAPKEYRAKKVMEMYGDNEKDAYKNIEKSDKNRSSYYQMISGKIWGKSENYDLCIDSSIGKEKTAKIISEKRKNYAEVLSSLIVEILVKLELPKCRFEIGISETELCENGIDDVEFLISTNVSEPLRPLEKVASGGEISRVMLALKSIFAQNDDIDTVIFDEIDTGISGKTSQSVADEIAELAKYRQIIMITHQAILAAKADRHFYVKKTQGQSTDVRIYNLSDEDKLNALAELASGEITEESLNFAKTLVG